MLARKTAGWVLFGAVLVARACLAAPGSASDFSSASAALQDEPLEFLPVDEAFKPSAQVAGEDLYVSFWIHEGYYLYRHRFGFSTAEPGMLGEAQIPAGEKKQDEYFGEVEVYHDQVDVTLPLKPGPERFTLTVEYQGCAEAGLCYPPTRKQFSLARGDSSVAMPLAAGPATPPPSAEGGDLTSTLAGGSLLTILLLFFAAGIGLAFTPCVLPMVPILSSIIVGRREVPSRWSAFTLSLAYVVGMAVTYAILGTLVGYFGAEFNLQARLQSPPVLIFLAVLFAVLALAMFDVYTLQMPEALRDRLNRVSERSQGGEYIGVATMGVVSSLVVSPCVSAPLAGALVYISTTGDALLGGTALLALGLGMGVPLLVIGTSGGDLLPRAGKWMNAVKLVFGFMLLGVAVWLLERILPAEVTMLLWGALAAGLSLALIVPRLAREYGEGWFLRVIGLAAGLYGVLLVAGGVAGSVDPVRPWLGFTEAGRSRPLVFSPVDSLTEIEARLTMARGNFPMMLDFYADWCVSCKVMEREVFPQPDVRDAMATFGRMRIDVTDNLPAQREVLDHYGLFGPPAILFFDPDGKELRQFRIQGEIGAEGYLNVLRNVLKSSKDILTVSGTAEIPSDLAEAIENDPYGSTIGEDSHTK